MTGVVLTDPILHAHLGGAATWRTIRWLRDCVVEEALGPSGDAALDLIRHLKEDMAGPSDENLIEQLYASTPTNLAERLHEALSFYRAFGRAALPPLLPLARRLLQAEMHLYSSLKGGKPYREHLAHQTRVAALAHLFLVEGSRPQEAEPGGSSLPLPAGLRWEHLRHRWSRSFEFHLLRRHALRCDLDCPEPGREDDPWREVVRAAALLAGVTHDIGYVHKALGQTAEPVGLTLEGLSFAPRASLPEEIDRLPLGGFYRRVVREVDHGQRHAPFERFLERYYRELHSMVGAVWLATVLANLRREVTHSPSTFSGRGWQAEMAFQLGAMMAFAHDLAMSDKARREQLGLRTDGDRDVLEIGDFPLSTLFTLCDVLQEFGRPLRVNDGDVLRFVVPVVGLRCRAESTAEKATERERFLRVLLGLPPAQAPRPGRMRIAFATQVDERLLPEAAARARHDSVWRETFVATKVADWLERAGLSQLVALEGEPETRMDLKRRIQELEELGAPSEEPSARLGGASQDVRWLLDQVASPTCKIDPGELFHHDGLVG